MIYLRYGSLKDDAHVMHTFQELRKFTGLSLSTMHKIVFRWLRAGKDITNMNPITSGSSLRNKNFGLPLRKHFRRWRTCH